MMTQSQELFLFYIYLYLVFTVTSKKLINIFILTVNISKKYNFLL